MGSIPLRIDFHCIGIDEAFSEHQRISVGGWLATDRWSTSEDFSGG
jgi:hypothetical protein